ncbi:MAG: ATPase [Desulfobacterales bacterium]|nr:MAG: ATPase [Desulfobacterales bacterium]
MISVDSSILIQIANFVVLIFILNAIFYKPIRNILQERRKKIQGYEEGIQALHDEAAEGEQAFQTKVGDAKTKGFQEKETLVQAGQEEERRLLDEINQKAQADLEAVRAQIAKDAEDARRSLKGQAEAFAGAIAEKILGRAVS